MTCVGDCPSCFELEAIRQRACVRKQAYGAKAAREIAADRNRVENVHQAYRCQFGDHYHVGHRLSWEGVVRLAALLRHRSYPTKGTAA
jgi:hypothetical protein